MKLITLLLFVAVITTTAAQNITEVKMADVVQLINQPNDTTYIVNFWATFCKPCVQEMPGLLKLAEKYKGQKVTLLLVSVDLPSFYPKRIASFVATQKWNASIAWLNETNADYFCPMIDSSWSGAIPATVVVNAKRGYKKFWEGDVSERMLNGELKNIVAVQKGNGYFGKFSCPMNEVTKVESGEDFLRTPSHGRHEFVTFYSKDSTVYASSDGVVRSIILVEDFTVLIVENKNYFFMYSNLGSVNVKKGDTIKTNDVIGHTTKNLDGEIAVDIYLSNQEGNIFTLKKENFLPRYTNDFYLLPAKNIMPQ